MTVFRRRAFVSGIRWITEGCCLELARVLHLGARPDELGKLIEEAACGAATVHLIEGGRDS